MAQSHDIEDVLSSIRRLVANEAGPTARPRLPDADRKEGPTLVLNDTHRVTEPEDPFQMIRMLAQEERDGRDAKHLTTAQPEDLAAITSDLAHGDDSTVWDDDEQSGDAPDIDDDAQPKAERNNQAGGAHEDEAEDTHQQESDANESTAYERGAVAHSVEADVHLPDDYVEDTDYEAEADERGDEKSDENHVEAQPGDDHHEMTSDVEREENPTAYPSDDAAADAPVFRPSARSGQTAALADLSSSLDGDEALRDLIAEIVRQELAGELGERITRNVRKLVRREIRQMLASDEFD